MDHHRGSLCAGNYGHQLQQSLGWRSRGAAEGRKEREREDEEGTLKSTLKAISDIVQKQLAITCMHAQ